MKISDVTKSQQERAVTLYRHGVKQPEIYDLVFPAYSKTKTDGQKRTFVRMILQRAGCILDQDERGKIIHKHRTPKTWKSKSKWMMR